MKNRTKSIIAIVAVVILGSGSLMAQDISAGVKGGMNFSNLIQNEIEDNNMRIGWHAGLYAKAPISSHLFLQPELAYSTKGNRITYDVVGASGESTLNLNYIDLPVLLGIQLTEGLSIHAGPYVSYLVHTNIDTSGDFGDGQEELDRDHFNSFDYGLAGGVAYQVGGVTIGGRYNYGLSQLADSDVAEAILEDSRNSVGQVYIAFQLTD